MLQICFCGISNLSFCKKERMISVAESKTNAMRMLDRAKVPYQVHLYSHDDGQIDGVSVANKLGQNVSTVYKTLVTRGHSGGFYVFVVSVAKELDLKKAAKSVGEKSVEMIRVDEINKYTGYIRGGCSPVGMKKLYPTVFDAPAQELERIMVSGGRIGCQIELEPKALAELVKGKFADISFAEQSL